MSETDTPLSTERVELALVLITYLVVASGDITLRRGARLARTHSRVSQQVLAAGREHRLHAYARTSSRSGRRATPSSSAKRSRSVTVTRRFSAP